MASWVYSETVNDETIYQTQMARFVHAASAG